MCSPLELIKSNKPADAHGKISVNTINAFRKNKDHFRKIYQTSFYNVNSNDPPVVVDTGASTSITPFLSDFIDDLKPGPINQGNQLSGKTQVVGRGVVIWQIVEMWNNIYTYRTEAYYIPTASIQLFSPQKYFQEQNNGSCTLKKDRLTIEIEDSIMEFPYNPGGNLPLMLTESSQKNFMVAGLQVEEKQLIKNPSILSVLLSIMDQTNQNITHSQKELLLWHQRLGHINIQWVKSLCAQPRNSTSGPKLTTKCKYVSTCENPICTACQLAKQTR